MLTLGVVDLATAEATIRRGFELAGKTESAQDYAAIVKCLQGFAKLEIDVAKLKRTNPQQHLHLHGNVNVDVDSGGISLSAITAKMGLHQLAERCRSGEFGAG